MPVGIIFSIIKRIFGSKIYAIITTISTIGLLVATIMLGIKMEFYKTRYALSEAKVHKLNTDLKECNNRIKEIVVLENNEINLLQKKIHLCYNDINQLQTELYSQNICSYVQTLTPNNNIKTTNNPKNDKILNALDNLFK